MRVRVPLGPLIRGTRNFVSVPLFRGPLCLLVEEPPLRTMLFYTMSQRRVHPCPPHGINGGKTVNSLTRSGIQVH